MIVSLIITFRETLEAALIIGIILSYLSKIKRHDVKKYVYIAGILGVIISIIIVTLYLPIFQMSFHSF